MKPAKFEPASETGFRYWLYDTIFGYKSANGLTFDVLLLIAIFASVICICLETVAGLQSEWGGLLQQLEWVFTILFAAEYVTRLYCVKRPGKYATSFFGVVDLLAFLPSFIGLLPIAFSTQSFTVIRALRLLRVFRILKLAWFMGEADDLGRAMLRARAKIVVFLGVVLICVTIAGTVMYEVENVGRHIDPDAKNLTAEQVQHNEKVQLAITQLESTGLTVSDLQETEESKFTSIPQAMYWAIVTMTTVGYGDIVPTTTLGKFVTAILIMLGYSLIIVPTGFVSAEMVTAKQSKKRQCTECGAELHDRDSRYCKHCGEKLPSPASAAEIPDE